MESTQAKVRYATFAKVTSVEERFKQVYVKGFGPDTETKQESLGWFLFMEGSHEALCLGAETPDVKPGDMLKITIERTTPNETSKN